MPLTASHTVPGVYRRGQPAATAAPRVRTDVLGFVGFAAPLLAGSSPGQGGVPTAVRLDDWSAYLEAFAGAGGGPPGSVLADAVQAFFRNGGSRCYVLNLGAPPVDPTEGRQRLALMLGLQSMPAAQGDFKRLQAAFTSAHGGGVVRDGLEALLVEEEVAVIALPDLFVTVPSVEQAPSPIVLTDRARFRGCDGLGSAAPAAPAARAGQALLYSDEEILVAQQYVLWRCAPEAWRVFVLLTPPPGKNVDEVVRWRSALGTWTHGALYWPWLVEQDELGGGTPRTVPPLGAVAGVYARRDLARGPHVSPANEPLAGIVDVESPVDDRVNAQAAAAGVNILRSFGDGGGIQVWGARTLTWGGSDGEDQDAQEALPPDDPLRWVSGRRSLSAIERTAWHLGQQLVFEPNDPFLRAKVVHTMTGYLASVYRSGVLAGGSPDQAFFVRCDGSNNPPAPTRQGTVLCEVGVALAVPAEFIVFRLSRQDAGLSVAEA
jgi:hypothetical protein